MKRIEGENLDPDQFFGADALTNCWREAFRFLCVFFCLLTFSLTMVSSSQAAEVSQEDALRCQNEGLLKRKIVIVGGYSTGAEYAALMQQLGIARDAIIHVHMPHGLSPLYSRTHDPARYGHEIVIPEDGDLTSVIAALKEFDIGAVVAGTEVSVRDAERIASHFDVPQNDFALTQARTDKYEMHAALRREGIPAMVDFVSTDVEAILAWIFSPTGNAGKWPVVLKPRKSAGTQGVFICKNEAEVRAAAEKLLGSQTMLGTTVDEVLVQSFLRGTEYAVNIVAQDGDVWVVEILRYKKVEMQHPNPAEGSVRMYVYDEIVDLRNDPVATVLRNYVERAMPVLGLRNGPAHVEVMITEDRGPVLVEIGARLSGGSMHLITEPALGRSALGMATMAVVNPARYRELRALEQSPPSRLMAGRAVQILTRESGQITGVRHLDVIRGLPTYRRHALAGVGDRIVPTVDLETSPGIVWLAGPEEQVIADYRRIRELEPSLFEVSDVGGQSP